MLSNMLLNNQLITEGIKTEIKICIETNENENRTTPMGFSKSSGRREIQAYLKKLEKH